VYKKTFDWASRPDSERCPSNAEELWGISGDTDFSDTRACAQFPWHRTHWPTQNPNAQTPDSELAQRLSHDRLKPSQCSPGGRVELFMRTDLADRVHAMETLIRVLSLSCLSTTIPARVDGAPPPCNRSRAFATSMLGPNTSRT
jgi:hypothetical protein